LFVQKDGRTGEPLELERAAYVVDVGVGDENLLELEAELGKAALNAADFVAGIDDDGLTGLFVAQDGAVAGERADGEGLQDHGLIVRLTTSYLCAGGCGCRTAGHVAENGRPCGLPSVDPVGAKCVVYLPGMGI